MTSRRCKVVAVGEAAATVQVVGRRDALSITRRNALRDLSWRRAAGTDHRSANEWREARRPIQPLSTRADTSSSHRRIRRPVDAANRHVADCTRRRLNTTAPRRRP